MDLKEFVRESLIEITAGIKEAQGPVREAGGYVNPPVTVSTKADLYFGDFLGRHVFLVDFDVALVVNEGTGTSAEAKLKVASFLSLGASGNSNESQQTTSRIKFRVPLAVPTDEQATIKHDEVKAKPAPKLGYSERQRS
jgi:hypothetical protein